MTPPNNRPPKWADDFLEWFCHPDLLEEIQGDVHELFDMRSRKKSPKAARRHFIWDVLRSFRLSTIKGIPLNLSTDMFKNNIKIAFRQLHRQKMYSAIKIGGFALGIAACILIALFVREELSYDQHYPEKDRLFRLVGLMEDGGKMNKQVWFPPPMATALKNDFPEVVKTGRINPGVLFGGGNNQVRRIDKIKNVFEDGFVHFDQSLLEMLKVPMLEGQLEEALASPNSIVISKSKADKFFPRENPIGKTLIINDDKNREYTVGGVMKDFPENSHLQFDFLMSLTEKEFFPGEQTSWRSSNYHTYLLLQPNTDIKELEKKMMSIVDKYVIPSVEGKERERITEMAKRMSFQLQPITDIHLYSDGIHDLLSHGDIRYIWLFSGIAIFILLIACINFINLSTAKSANRAKEVGLRKVIGSLRSQLIGQFLSESALFSVLSFIIGAGLANLLLPYFNTLSGKELVFPWQEWWLIPMLLLGALVVGLFAGLYPSFYLSSFRPINVLKGNLSTGSKSSSMRNALVVFQFTTSIILIIGTFVIYQQMEFILNKKVGFDKEQVVLLKGAHTQPEKVASLKEELLRLSDVSHVAASSYLPISGMTRNGNTFRREGRAEEDTPVPGQFWQVDHDYIETMGMELSAGRNFSRSMPTDSQAIIINEAMVAKMGLQNPIGQGITNGGLNLKVIGVVKNFHYESLKEDIRPLCIALGSSLSVLSVKVSSTDMSRLIPQLTSVWEKFYPNQPIRYGFLDKSYEIMYADVAQIRSIFTSFAILAILIACLGLFALSAFMAEQRSKEISIRKVLGASTANLLRLMTQNFLILVLISLTIAIPIAWYAMRRWLDDFAFRIEMGWQIFAFAGIAALLIALLTISYQAMLAATRNPVDALGGD